MKKVDYKTKEEKDILKEISSLKEDLKNHRFNMSSAKEKKPHEVRMMRKNITRLLTELKTR